MTQLIPVIIAGGLIKALLAVFGENCLSLLSASSDTYVIFNAIGDAAFYFLPIFVALSESKKLGCNSFLAMMLGAMLIHPGIISLLGGEAPTSLFGFIPVVHGSYSSSVIPAMLAVILLKYVELLVDKITPEWSKSFLKPLLIILITAPVTLCVLAPLGQIAGAGLQTALEWVYGLAPWLAMTILSALMPFIVMTGMHWAFVQARLSLFQLRGMISCSFRQCCVQISHRELFALEQHSLQRIKSCVRWHFLPGHQPCLQELPSLHCTA